METKYIQQYENIFNYEECDLILKQRIEDSFDGERVTDFLIYKDEANDTWKTIIKSIQEKTEPVVKSYLKEFLGLMPPNIIDISHIGFLNDNFGSFTEIHYDWELVVVDKKRYIPKPFVMLIYLNDDYDGGELLFPLQKYKTSPKKGSVAIFPCNFCFPHVSQPVMNGSKHVCRITFKIDIEYYNVDELEI